MRLSYRTSAAAIALVLVLLVLFFTLSGVPASSAPAGDGVEKPLWPKPGELQTWARFAMGVLPAALIFSHWVYIARRRKKELPQRTNHDSSAHNPQELYFGRGQIAIRYLPPTLVALIGCYLVTSILLWPELYTDLVIPPPALRAARFGFLGAYSYVIALLAQRMMRHDITAGVAMWSAVMFVLGPLTGFMASFLQGQIAGISAPAATTLSNWDVVYFGAGMLPRQFLAVVQETTRRLLQPGQPINVARTVPLTTVRGIDAAIAERLQEEGIEDACTLAYANPFLLMRSTYFERRQLVDWIDEALLIRLLPSGWEELEKHGVSGARAVVALKDADATLLGQLATAAKLTPEEFRLAIQWLSSDQHLKELSALYDRATGEVASAAAAPPANAPAPPASVKPGTLWFACKDGMTDDEIVAALQKIDRLDEVVEIDFTRPLGSITLKAAADHAAVAELLAQLGFSFAALK